MRAFLAALAIVAASFAAAPAAADVADRAPAARVCEDWVSPTGRSGLGYCTSGWYRLSVKCSRYPYTKVVYAWGSGGTVIIAVCPSGYRAISTYVG
jgi:hypothetical protein